MLHQLLKQLFEILTFFLLGSDTVLTGLYYDACEVTSSQDDIAESDGSSINERESVLAYARDQPREGDRRITWMMADEDNQEYGKEL